MTEKLLWQNYLQSFLHRPHLGRAAWKVQDAFRKGLPDVDVCVRGSAHKLELKYVKDYPTRESTRLRIALTREQHRYLDEWARAGGSALVLVGVGRDWYLLAYDDAREPLLVDELLARARAYGALTDLEPLVAALAHRETHESP